MENKIEQGNTIKVEEDKPMYKVNQQMVSTFTVDTNNRTDTKSVNKDVFNTVKGHNLLGWCVVVLVGIYLFELFVDKGKISSVGTDVIEIIKLLIFSLTGYLFGTNSAENKK